MKEGQCFIPQYRRYTCTYGCRIQSDDCCWTVEGCSLLCQLTNRGTNCCCSSYCPGAW